MRRALRLVLPLLLGLPALALGALLLLFDPDALRPRAEAAATGALGLPVRIAEPLRWRPGLLPAVEARGVTVTGADGAPLLSLGRAAAELALGPLLARRLVVARLALEDGVLRADPAALPARRSAPPAGERGPAREAAPLPVELRDARLRRFRIATAAGEVEIAEARLAARWPEGPLALEGEASWRGLSLALAAAAPGMAGPVTARLDAGGLALRATLHRTAGGWEAEWAAQGRDLSALAPLVGGAAPPLRDLAFAGRGPLGAGRHAFEGRFDWAGLPVALAGEGEGAAWRLRAEAARGTLTLEGRFPEALTLALRLPALAPFSAPLGRPLPALTDLRLDARLADLSAAGAAIPAFALASSAGDLAGALALRWGERPSLAGRVDSRRLDLAALRAPPAAAPPPGPAAAAPAAGPARVIPELPLGLAALSGFDADLAFRLGALQDGALDLRDVEGRFATTGGRARLDPFAATLAGGRLALRAAADAARDPPVLHLAGGGEGFDLAALLAALGGTAPSGGRADLDFDLRGQGETTRAFAATLTGHLGLAVIDGRLGGTLAAVLGQLSPALAQGVPLACLALRAEADRGVLRFPALLLDGAAGRIGGEGTIALADEALALRLLTDLRVGGVRLRAPVPLTGSLANPRLAAPALIAGALAGAPGGALPDCAAALALARGGRPGPQPAPLPAIGPREAPAVNDLIRGLLEGRR